MAAPRFNVGDDVITPDGEEGVIITYRTVPNSHGNIGYSYGIAVPDDSIGAKQLRDVPESGIRANESQEYHRGHNDGWAAACGQKEGKP